MPLLTVDWPEPLHHCSGAAFSTVGKRNEDEIAFVALNIFEVLDEQWLASFFCFVVTAQVLGTGLRQA
jgi:hypothetical protein